MKKFHDLTVKEVKRETPETVSLTFDVSAGEKNLFAYKQGQHLTVKAMIEGQEIRRSYSICNSVADDELKVAVRHVDGGAFSTYANMDLKAGDVLEVMPPLGHFYIDLEPESARNYLMVAAGSGITPILSIIKTTLETEPNARVTLLYGNRTVESTIFRSEISQLKNRFLDQFTFFHFMSQQPLEVEFFNGRLDGAKTKASVERILAGQRIDHAFVCGPQAMIMDVAGSLKECGLDEKQIHSELFGTGEGALEAPVRRASAIAQASKAELEIIIDGELKRVAMPDGETNILDAMADAGVDAPFSCKGGVCATCRAKVLEGEVDMTLNYGLEKEEIAAGFVLTCQSFPKTDKVRLSFDE
ncbi:1,2-phenylacetyl-CoA epoxidase subunit PaaE [Kordiimonas aquimaris]|uniref:1,2-phenylacetyl-CoA epoxidase subunit PaaE n=1 Tax=Kordiimonas aquimaris TaxID=707591 RepID=UPI0021CFB7EF|nr:1,2-phenylacetyl-CoA epoxidase subunit PaaE [Kordiimonas aquimaris]